MLRTRIGSVDVRLDTKRFDRQFAEAQKKLNELVVSDSTPYIPFLQGQLRSQVRYPDGIYGSSVEWYAPYAHYQYMGEIYGDPETGAGGYYTDGYGWWSRKDVAKIPTGRSLEYHEPGTGAKWFETAKQAHQNEWLKTVKRIAGGG